MNTSLDRKITLGLVAALAALGVLGGVALWQTRRLVDETRSVSHAHESLASIRALSTLLTEAEASQLRYLLTGDTAALIPYRGALVSVSRQLRELARLTTDNARQQDVIGHLDPVIADRLALMRRNVAVREERGIEPAIAGVRSTEVRRARDSIRVLLRGMEREEQRLLAARLGSEQQQSRLVGVLLPLALGAVVLFVALGGAQVQREIAERREVERLKTDLVAMAAHELRSPLGSIRTALGVLEKRHGALLSDAAREMLRIAREQTDRLLRLVSSFLDLEQIERGDIRWERASVRSDDIVRTTLEGLESTAALAEVTLLAGRIDEARLRGDRDRLVQVLTNLVANAVKFTPSGGAVTVSVARTDGVARFQVEDEGPGIEPAETARLFQSFRRTGAQAPRGDTGTGLGLAISRVIVERHDGRIGVDSTPGQGSRFWFELPVDSG